MATHVQSSTPADALACSVLVVDDENCVRDLMSRWLQAGGYEVASASGADEALGLIQTASPAVALCDIRMPGHDGLWLADRIRQQHPDTAVIMATGVHDVGAAVASLGDGVVGYLTKPFGRERLRDAVVCGIEWHRSARDSRYWRERLEGELQARQTRLATAIGALHLESDRMVDAMMSILTLGDTDAYGHARQVSALAAAIGDRLGLPHEEVATIRRAGLVHDLGKLAIPEAILRKPAPLTPEEHAIVRRYPQLGADLIAPLPYLAVAAEIVRNVQQRPDGLGYPAASDAGAISIGSRVVAAADAYLTMIGWRLFRDPLTSGDAMLEMERCSGTQFDPHVVAVLKQIVAVH